MPQPERVFLDWSEPTATAAARWLMGRSAGMLAIVPTRQAGRNLLRAMGDATVVMTPAQFLEPAGEDLADPLQSTLALAEELAGPRAARCRALFPAGLPVRNFPERLALAQNLRGLRAELSEHGLSIRAAADRLAPESAEAARWRDLDRLFAGADELLARAGLSERETIRLSNALAPRLPPNVNGVIVIGVADLQPAVALALERSGAPVTVLIPGPAEPDAFDAWGRPLAGAWSQRDPGWSDFDAQVRLLARPENLELDLGGTEALEIGLLDRDLLPALAESAAAAGRTIHDPAGLPLSMHWLARALGAFATLAAEPAFDGAVNLLRGGATRAWLAQRVPALDLELALTLADEIRASHFPATLHAAQPWVRKMPPLPDVFAAVEKVLADLRNRPLDATQRLAVELTAAFGPQLKPPEAALLEPAKAAIDTILGRMRSAADDHAGFSSSDWLHALREAFSSASLYPERMPGAVEASGWLEMPWSDAPHLILAGMNMGRLPAPTGHELFLNESTRAALGLPGNAERRARDAYFLARVLAIPRRVDALVVQMDAQGSPLEPSPLLFAGAGDALPQRVERLFADAPPPRPDPAWSAGWLLDPPVMEMKRAIAVTDFERYLDCPFTFYLARVVRMKTFDPAVDELDAAQFGDLVHTALQRWALEDSAENSTDPAEIASALDSHISKWVERNLGRRLSLPLRLQVDSARARLAAFASWQAEDRRAGWRIRAIEQSFEDILGRPWEVDGWTISGRVDRLDENERDDRWRVIDYKTFDSADGPAKKHLRAFRSAGRIWPPDYARVNGAADWWINLQLPLYRQLLIESGRSPDGTACGYFNLPKTIAETGLQTWDELDADLQESAMACARGVLADLGRRRFWPPNPRAAHAEFSDMFPPDAARVVDPNGAFVRSCAA